MNTAVILHSTPCFRTYVEKSCVGKLCNERCPAAFDKQAAVRMSRDTPPVSGLVIVSGEVRSKIPTPQGSPAAANYLRNMPGWSYLVRLYPPRPEVIGGKWIFPEPTPTH